MRKIYLILILISFTGFSQSSGDVVVTEFMNDSKAVSDKVGEWIELYNNTNASIDLKGWSLKDDGSNSYTFNESVVIPAKSYFLIGRGPVDSTKNGGVNLNFSYGTDGYTLGNSDDEIILLSPSSVEIDRVNYGVNGFPDGGAGVSLSLDPSKIDGDNNNPSNWCVSTTTFGDGDFGTPGVANPTCAPRCTLYLKKHKATCKNITSATDTYSVTLPYLGASKGKTYTVTSTAGTVGGDNPTSKAEGTITVTGVPEGTNIIITIEDKANGGLCELTREVTSPTCQPTGTVELELKGILDFTIPNSRNAGKGIHLVATADIVDLSVYGIGVANNGGGTDGQEYTFPKMTVNKGEHILLARDLTEIEKYFTTNAYNLFNHKIAGTSSISQNGDDAIELFKNGNVIETFGDINVDGTGKDWEYKDSWAYKSTAGATWPKGWVYGAVDCTDKSTTIFETKCVYPFVASLSVEENNINNIGFYPNPISKFTPYLNIFSNSSELMYVKMYDVLGKLILKEKITDNRLNTSQLKSGIYFMKISQGRGNITRKIIVE